MDPVLLAADGSVLKTETPAMAFVLNAKQVEIIFTLPVATAPPTMVVLTDEYKKPRPYALNTARMTEAYVPRTVVVEGDFCKADATTKQCSTGLLDKPGQTKSPGAGGLVFSADGNDAALEVLEIGEGYATVRYTAPDEFKPVTLKLTGAGKAQTYPFQVAAPEVTTDAVYRTIDFNKLCPKPTKKDNAQTPATPCTPSITPVEPSSARATFISNDGELIFARISNRGEALPELLIVRNADAKQSVLARRLTPSASDQSLLSANMTIMDQETVRRNFGKDIAVHYIAVQLDVKNRTAKTLQFSKSAVWFDADYKESFGPRKQSGAFWSTVTIDAVPTNVYRAPFLDPNLDEYRTPTSHTFKGDKNKTVLHDYRFGIEQTSRLYPDSYLSILGAFDSVVEKSNRLFDYVQLFAGVLTTIATGGSVAQIHNFAFRDSANIFSGVFLPGYRSTTLDVAGTNRLRTNLVQQTLQDTVQVGPNGFASTLVMLPRDALMAYGGYNDTVVVDRILNVHIDPDVLNGIKDAPVPANHVEYGYTKDQVRQSLGEASGVSTDDAGVATFTYGKGVYVTVVFDKTGKVTTFTPRPLEEQVSRASTLEEAKSLLATRGASSKMLMLTNRHVILVDIEGVSKIPEYDENHKRVGDYSLKYAALQALTSDGNETKKDFETTLKGLVPVGTTLPALGTVGTPRDTQWTYPMPDIVGGTIVVEFESANVGPDTKIKAITFTGEKPTNTGEKSGK